MSIIRYKWFWVLLSVAFMSASIFAYATFGFRLSADFREGNLYELSFETAEGSEPLTQDKLRDVVNGYTPAEGSPELGTVEIKTTGEGRFLLRVGRMEEADSDAFLDSISAGAGEFTILQSRIVSPTFAEAFRDRAIKALLIASAMIILYITFAFRKVSQGIASWKLGLASIISLLHNVMITTGIFIVLGYFYGVEIDALFITALLTIMGYSVNDTIVVFDRIRENMFLKGHHESFDDVADKSIRQTLVRSINTGFGVILVLLSMLFYGADELYYFILALLIGIVVGTYSSIFFATPLLTLMRR